MMNSYMVIWVITSMFVRSFLGKFDQFVHDQALTSMFANFNGDFDEFVHSHLGPRGPQTWRNGPRDRLIGLPMLINPYMVRI